MKGIIFDFYGTLAEAHGIAPSWDDLFSELGYEVSHEARARLWNEGVDGLEHDEHSRSRDHYVTWQQERVREVIQASGVRSGDDDVLFSRILEWFGPDRLGAYSETRDVLTELRARGLRIAICSNWDWDLHEAIAAAGLEDLADIVVSSAWVGARKPHPRIYAHTLEALDLAAGDVVFVGDTWSCDVEGPRAFGMRPLYLRRPHFGPDATAPDENDGDRLVDRISDLAPVLDLVQ